MIVLVDERPINVSHPDKLLFADPDVSKKALLDYFVKIAIHMVPHVQDRLCTLRRFPDGIYGAGFFQKNISDYFPTWLQSVSVPKEGGSVRHMLCNDRPSLAYIASQACIELHVSLSRRNAIDRPDRLVFDLDPPDGRPDAARNAAIKVRALLESFSLTSYVMTTGSAGYHVVVPIKTSHSFDQTRAFARSCAEELTNEYPDQFTVEMRIADRGSRVFLDYLRNSFGQTTIAPYSLRARPGAPVATPIEWRELSRTDPDHYHIGNIFRRLAQRPDPWQHIDREPQHLPKTSRG